MAFDTTSYGLFSVLTSFLSEGGVTWHGPGNWKEWKEKMEEVLFPSCLYSGITSNINVREEITCL